MHFDLKMKQNAGLNSIYNKGPQKMEFEDNFQNFLLLKTHVVTLTTRDLYCFSIMSHNKCFICGVYTEITLNTLLFNLGNYFFTQKIPGFRDYYN